MHNNYYFLRALAAELDTTLQGFTLVSCFSQNKDELIIELNNRHRSFFIKISLLPEFQCISFPDKFHRARKNSIDLFNEILMKRLMRVLVYRNERSIGVTLEDGTMPRVRIDQARCTTTLPLARPDSTRASASLANANGNTLSRTGRMLPASISVAISRSCGPFARMNKNA